MATTATITPAPRPVVLSVSVEDISPPSFNWYSIFDYYPKTGGSVSDKPSRFVGP